MSTRLFMYGTSHKVRSDKGLGQHTKPIVFFEQLTVTVSYMDTP